MKSLQIDENSKNSVKKTRRFLGARIPEKLYLDFANYAKEKNESKSNLMRYLIENADWIMKKPLTCFLLQSGYWVLWCLVPEIEAF